MRFRYRRTIIISVLAVCVLVAVGASMLFANSPNSYDSNHNGKIDENEAYRDLRDYFDAGLSQEQVIDVLLH